VVDDNHFLEPEEVVRYDDVLQDMADVTGDVGDYDGVYTALGQRDGCKGDDVGVSAYP
jgi:hypothetical protein